MQLSSHHLHCKLLTPLISLDLIPRLIIKVLQVTKELYKKKIKEVRREVEPV